MIQLVLTLCLLITSSFAALAQDAVATLYSSTGVVEVTLSKSMRTTQGREGLLLYERDLVRTGVDGKATILFRDGSEIRLFENTEFQIQEASEQGAGERSFRRKLFLRFGAFLSNFFGRSDHTVIETPHFQLKPEGTSFHVQALKEQGSVALFSGKLLVQNVRGKALLEPGEAVLGVNRGDILSDRIEMLTQQLQLQADPKELVRGRSSQKLLLRIQARGREGQRIGAGLPIRIMTDGEGVRIPGELSLDKEGKAEVEVQLLAPDRLYRKGLLRFNVMVDDPRGLKISGTEIEIRKPGAVKRLEIDADTGQILPRK
ncbi:MAG: FecR family protein [Deltaproteobacteria bacterium]